MKRSYPFVNPIIVDKNNNIVDGGHRYDACIQNNWDISYVTVESVYDFEAIDEIQKTQKEKLEEFYLKNNVDFKAQIQTCSSRDRMEKFIQFNSSIKSDREYWELLSAAYTISDNNYTHLQSIKNLFLSQRSEKRRLMSFAEREFLKKLNDQVTIYRAMTVDESLTENYGISWTLVKAVADTFATTYVRNYATNKMEKVVIKLIIPKKDILAIFLERGESEVIYIKE